jgi:hypothetical protein
MTSIFLSENRNIRYCALSGDRGDAGRVWRWFGRQKAWNELLDLEVLKAFEIPQNRQRILWKCLDRTSGNLESLGENLEAGGLDP